MIMKPGNPNSGTGASVFILLLFLLHLTVAAAPPSPPPSVCSDELVNFSDCVPYISLPPNDLTNAPSTECCDDFASTFSAGNGVCVCYLIQQPNILGLPINSSRVLSLTSLCAVNANPSLDSLCSGSPTLPPLPSNTGPRPTRRRPRRPPRQQPPPPPRRQPPPPPPQQPRPPPPPSRPGNDSSHPPIEPPPEKEPPPEIEPPPEVTLAPQPTKSSSATMKMNKKCRCILPGILVFLVHHIRRLPLVYM